ncbi:MAG: hypothetical protein ACI9OU_001006, partial [Candidatus Promineifilaceae bacterium]
RQKGSAFQFSKWSLRSTTFHFLISPPGDTVFSWSLLPIA